MTSVTAVKLLTLLNVSAVKRARELDLPGGHRGSPSPVIERDEREPKRRKSVVFGGEVGPSGSTFARKSNGRSGVKKVINGEAGTNGHREGNEDLSGDQQANGDEEDGGGIEVDKEGSDDEGASEGEGS